MKLKQCVLGTAAVAASLVLLFGAPAVADTVFAGTDLWVTPGNPTGVTPTSQDLNLPAGFYGATSDPFTGTVFFVGQPFLDAPFGSAQGADTVVARLQDATVNSCGDVDTVPIEIIALSLQSNEPITVDCGAQSADYAVDAFLSSIVAQQPGSMTIRHECADGGRFDTSLPVTAKLVFTKVGGDAGCGNPTVTLDPAPQNIFIATQGLWAHNDLGFGVFTTVGGLADSDGDGIVDSPFPASSNFFPGVGYATCTCSSQLDPKKRLTSEEEMLAKHGVLPPEPAGPDSDGDGIPDHADNCINIPNPMQEDMNKNCVGDICDEEQIPTLSTWGLIAFGILLLGAMMYVTLRRRRVSVVTD